MCKCGFSSGPRFGVRGAVREPAPRAPARPHSPGPEGEQRRRASGATWWQAAPGACPDGTVGASHSKGEGFLLTDDAFLHLKPKGKRTC